MTKGDCCLYALSATSDWWYELIDALISIPDAESYGCMIADIFTTVHEYNDLIGICPLGRVTSLYISSPDEVCGRCGGKAPHYMPPVDTYSIGGDFVDG